MAQDGHIYEEYYADDEPVIQNSSEPARKARSRRLVMSDIAEETSRTLDDVKRDIEELRRQLRSDPTRLRNIRYGVGWREGTGQASGALRKLQMQQRKQREKIRKQVTPQKREVDRMWERFEQDFDKRFKDDLKIEPGPFEAAYEKFKKKHIDPLKVKTKEAIKVQKDKASKTIKDAGVKAYDTTMNWFLGDLRKKNG